MRSGVEVEDIVMSNETYIVVVAAASAVEGDGKVTITSNTGRRLTKENTWEYLALGNITSVEPAHGQIGTFVTITGTDLLPDGADIGAVTLNGVTVQQIVSSNASTVVVQADEGAAGTGDVVIVADNGVIATGSDAWEYRTGGVIAAADPSTGIEGASVIIYGTSLRGHGSNIVGVIW